MKKILWLGIIFSLLFASHSFAAVSLSATATGNAVNVQLTGVTEKDISAVVITAEASPNSKSPENTTETLASDPSNGTLSFNISQFLNVTPIYIKAAVYYPNSSGVSVSDVSNEVTLTPSTETITPTPLTSVVSANSIVVTGKLDPTKNPWMTGSNFTATLVYSSSSTTNPTTGALQNPIAPPLTATINSDGTYTWTIPTTNLIPSGTYYIQQTITTSIKKTVKIDVVDTFSNSAGATLAAFNPTGSGASSSNLNPSDYNLLEPLPGLSDLPSPQVCAQRQQAASAAGKSAPICDVNGLLNYALQLLIGISGVVLVFRLMFEGYQYMMTDVPFLKASSKAGFFSALGGLALALSAFIILNTINPKLVSESVGVVPLSIGVTEPDTDVTPITSNVGAPTSGAAGACTNGLTTVTVQNYTFTSCSTYNNIPIATNLKNMLTAAYAAGIILHGGGFRTQAQQIALRIAHCNGDTTNPSATCNPPTAVPGHSNHESGLAFDFTCNSSGTIKSQSSPCFIWLQANAATYGFQNLPSEPWHWSWNGH